MSLLKVNARRATVEDLPRLKELWAIMRFDVEDLERHLTDFQVAETIDGEIVGCIAFQIASKQGCIHSESYEDFSHADRGRPELWARIGMMAQNHGLNRLWTREDSPFWTRSGFSLATEAELAKRPAVWDKATGNWHTLKLRDEEAMASMEKEFALFVESEKQQRSELLGKAKVIKVLVLLGITLIILIFAAGMIWLLLKRKSGGL